jgi:hypothetical protein
MNSEREIEWIFRRMAEGYQLIKVILFGCHVGISRRRAATSIS